MPGHLHVKFKLKWVVLLLHKNCPFLALHISIILLNPGLVNHYNELLNINYVCLKLNTQFFPYLY